jgi:hypothetical protein
MLRLPHALSGAAFFSEGKKKKGETVYRQFLPELVYHIQNTLQALFTFVYQ